MGMNITRRSLVKAAAAGLALAVPPSLGGCAQGSTSSLGVSDAKGGPLTVYLWDTDLIRTLAPYLHEQLPDTEIQFIAGNNDTDLYSYLLEHDALPDVITVRRFAGTEAMDLRPYLVDFGSYNVVSKFSSYSLQYYKGDDGEVNWLPVCGIPQTIIANKTLFEQNGLELPESYEEYAQVCRAFFEKGIKPYALDLAEDWSSHEMVQAGGIGELTALDGITWRAQAESSQGDISFDEALWRKVFSHTATLLSDSYFTAEDLGVDTVAAMQLFVQGKAAMFHGSPIHLKQCEEQMDAELVRVPYFSQTSSEGYIYMTPSLHIAMNKSLEDSQEKLSAALAMLDCMLSIEGQTLIANGTGVISFNPDVASLTDGMVGLEDEIDNNQYYIRYSSQKSFDASVKAVTGLLSGSMNSDQAFEAFRNAINSADVAERPVTTFEKTYPLSLNESKGREAASSILSTARDQVGAQLALAPYYYFASSIYEGECSASRADLMVASKPNAASLYLETLSGAQIRELVKRSLSGGEKDFRPVNEYELPVASGMKLVVQDGGSSFTLKDLLVDGKSLDDEAQYSILLTSGVVSGLAEGLEPMPGMTLSSVWALALEEGGQPAEPQDYIEVRR